MALLERYIANFKRDNEIVKKMQGELETRTREFRREQKEYE